MDNVHCQGEEEFLSHRRSNDWGNHDYNHGEDASVDCIPLPYWAYVTAFSQNGILLDYLFPRKRLLEPTYVIRSMKREEKKKKKAVLCGNVFGRKPRKFRLSFAVFQYSNLSFPYLADLIILCKFFTLSTWRVAEKIGRRVEFFCNFRVYQRLSAFWFSPL